MSDAFTRVIVYGCNQTRPTYAGSFSAPTAARPFIALDERRVPQTPSSTQSSCWNHGDNDVIEHFATGLVNIGASTLDPDIYDLVGPAGCAVGKTGWMSFGAAVRVWFGWPRASDTVKTRAALKTTQPSLACLVARYFVDVALDGSSGASCIRPVDAASVSGMNYSQVAAFGGVGELNAAKCALAPGSCYCAASMTTAYLGGKLSLASCPSIEALRTTLSCTRTTCRARRCGNSTMASRYPAAVFNPAHSFCLSGSVVLKHGAPFARESQQRIMQEDFVRALGAHLDTYELHGHVSAAHSAHRFDPAGSSNGTQITWRINLLEGQLSKARDFIARFTGVGGAGGTAGESPSLDLARSDAVFTCQIVPGSGGGTGSGVRGARAAPPGVATTMLRDMEGRILGDGQGGGGGKTCFASFDLRLAVTTLAPRMVDPLTNNVMSLSGQPGTENTLEIRGIPDYDQPPTVGTASSNVQILWLPTAIAETHSLQIIGQDLKGSTAPLTQTVVGQDVDATIAADKIKGGSGTGLSLTYQAFGGTTAITKLAVATIGSGYTVGDVLTVAKKDCPGGACATDLTITLKASDLNGMWSGGCPVGGASSDEAWHPSIATIVKKSGAGGKGMFNLSASLTEMNMVTTSCPAGQRCLSAMTVPTAFHACVRDTAPATALWIRLPGISFVFSDLAVEATMAKVRRRSNIPLQINGNHALTGNPFVMYVSEAVACPHTSAEASDLAARSLATPAVPLVIVGAEDTGVPRSFQIIGQDLRSSTAPLTQTVIQQDVDATIAADKIKGGSGTGLSLTYQANGGTTAITKLAVATIGSGYKVGEVLTVAKADCPGGPCTKDLTITLKASDLNGVLTALLDFSGVAANVNHRACVRQGARAPRHMYDSLWTTLGATVSVPDVTVVPPALWAGHEAMTLTTSIGNEFRTGDKIKFVNTNCDDFGTTIISERNKTKYDLKLDADKNVADHTPIAAAALSKAKEADGADTDCETKPCDDGTSGTSGCAAAGTCTALCKQTPTPTPRAKCKTNDDAIAKTTLLSDAAVAAAKAAATAAAVPAMATPEVTLTLSSSPNVEATAVVDFRYAKGIHRVDLKACWWSSQSSTWSYLGAPAVVTVSNVTTVERLVPRAPKVAVTIVTSGSSSQLLADGTEVVFVKALCPGAAAASLDRMRRNGAATPMSAVNHSATSPLVVDLASFPAATRLYACVRTVSRVGVSTHRGPWYFVGASIRVSGATASSKNVLCAKTAEKLVGVAAFGAPREKPYMYNLNSAKRAFNTFNMTGASILNSEGTAAVPRALAAGDHLRFATRCADLNAKSTPTLVLEPKYFTALPGLLLRTNWSHSAFDAFEAGDVALACGKVGGTGAWVDVGLAVAVHDMVAVPDVVPPMKGMEIGLYSTRGPRFNNIPPGPHRMVFAERCGPSSPSLPNAPVKLISKVSDDPGTRATLWRVGGDFDGLVFSTNEVRTLQLCVTTNMTAGGGPWFSAGAPLVVSPTRSSRAEIAKNMESLEFFNLVEPLAAGTSEDVAFSSSSSCGILQTETFKTPAGTCQHVLRDGKTVLACPALNLSSVPLPAPMGSGGTVLYLCASSSGATATTVRALGVAVQVMPPRVHRRDAVVPAAARVPVGLEFATALHTGMQAVQLTFVRLPGESTGVVCPTSHAQLLAMLTDASATSGGLPTATVPVAVPQRRTANMYDNVIVDFSGVQPGRYGLCFANGANSTVFSSMELFDVAIVVADIAGARPAYRPLKYSFSPGAPQEQRVRGLEAVEFVGGDTALRIMHNDTLIFARGQCPRNASSLANMLAAGSAVSVTEVSISNVANYDVPDSVKALNASNATNATISERKVYSFDSTVAMAADFSNAPSGSEMYACRKKRPNEHAILKRYVRRVVPPPFEEPPSLYERVGAAVTLTNVEALGRFVPALKNINVTFSRVSSEFTGLAQIALCKVAKFGRVMFSTMAVNSELRPASSTLATRFDLGSLRGSSHVLWVCGRPYPVGPTGSPLNAPWRAVGGSVSLVTVDVCRTDDKVFSKLPCLRKIPRGPVQLAFRGVPDHFWGVGPLRPSTYGTPVPSPWRGLQYTEVAFAVRCPVDAADMDALVAANLARKATTVIGALQKNITGIQVDFNGVPLGSRLMACIKLVDSTSLASTDRARWHAFGAYVEPNDVRISQLFVPPLHSVQLQFSRITQELIAGDFIMFIDAFASETTTSTRCPPRDQAQSWFQRRRGLTFDETSKQWITDPNGNGIVATPASLDKISLRASPIPAGSDLGSKSTGSETNRLTFDFSGMAGRTMMGCRRSTGANSDWEDMFVYLRVSTIHERIVRPVQAFPVPLSHIPYGPPGISGWPATPKKAGGWVWIRWTRGECYSLRNPATRVQIATLVNTSTVAGGNPATRVQIASMDAVNDMSGLDGIPFPRMSFSTSPPPSFNFSGIAEKTYLTMCIQDGGDTNANVSPVVTSLWQDAGVAVRVSSTFVWDRPVVPAVDNVPLILQGFVNGSSQNTLTTAQLSAKSIIYVGDTLMYARRLPISDADAAMQWKFTYGGTASIVVGAAKRGQARRRARAAAQGRLLGGTVDRSVAIKIPAAPGSLRITFDFTAITAGTLYLYRRPKSLTAAQDGAAYVDGRYCRRDYSSAGMAFSTTGLTPEEAKAKTAQWEEACATDNAAIVAAQPWELVGAPVSMSGVDTDPPSIGQTEGNISFVLTDLTLLDRLKSGDRVLFASELRGGCSEVKPYRKGDEWLTQASPVQTPQSELWVNQSGAALPFITAKFDFRQMQSGERLYLCHQAREASPNTGWLGIGAAVRISSVVIAQQQIPPLVKTTVDVYVNIFEAVTKGDRLVLAQSRCPASDQDFEKLKAERLTSGAGTISLLAPTAGTKSAKLVGLSAQLDTSRLGLGAVLFACYQPSGTSGWKVLGGSTRISLAKIAQLGVFPAQGAMITVSGINPSDVLANASNIRPNATFDVTMMFAARCPTPISGLTASELVADKQATPSLVASAYNGHDPSIRGAYNFAGLAKNVGWYACAWRERTTRYASYEAGAGEWVNLGAAVHTSGVTSVPAKVDAVAKQLLSLFQISQELGLLPRPGFVVEVSYVNGGEGAGCPRDDEVMAGLVARGRATPLTLDDKGKGPRITLNADGTKGADGLLMNGFVRPPQGSLWNSKTTFEVDFQGMAPGVYYACVKIRPEDPTKAANLLSAGSIYDAWQALGAQLEVVGLQQVSVVLAVQGLTLNLWNEPNVRDAFINGVAVALEVSVSDIVVTLEGSEVLASSGSSSGSGLSNATDCTLTSDATRRRQLNCSNSSASQESTGRRRLDISELRIRVEVRVAGSEKASELYNSLQYETGAAAGTAKILTSFRTKLTEKITAGTVTMTTAEVDAMTATKISAGASDLQLVGGRNQTYVPTAEPGMCDIVVSGYDNGYYEPFGESQATLSAKAEATVRAMPLLVHMDIYLRGKETENLLTAPKIRDAEGGNTPEIIAAYSTEFESECKYLAKYLICGHFFPKWDGYSDKGVPQRIEPCGHSVCARMTATCPRFPLSVAGRPLPAPVSAVSSASKAPYSFATDMLNVKLCTETYSAAPSVETLTSARGDERMCDPTGRNMFPYKKVGGLLEKRTAVSLQDGRKNYMRYNYGFKRKSVTGVSPDQKQVADGRWWHKLMAQVHPERGGKFTCASYVNLDQWIPQASVLWRGTNLTMHATALLRASEAEIEKMAPSETCFAPACRQAVERLVCSNVFPRLSYTKLHSLKIVLPKLSHRYMCENVNAACDISTCRTAAQPELDCEVAGASRLDELWVPSLLSTNAAAVAAANAKAPLYPNEEDATMMSVQFLPNLAASDLYKNENTSLPIVNPRNFRPGAFVVPTPLFETAKSGTRQSYWTNFRVLGIGVQTQRGMDNMSSTQGTPLEISDRRSMHVHAGPCAGVVDYPYFMPNAYTQPMLDAIVQRQFANPLMLSLLNATCRGAIKRLICLSVFKRCAQDETVIAAINAIQLGMGVAMNASAQTGLRCAPLRPCRSMCHEITAVGQASACPRIDTDAAGFKDAKPGWSSLIRFLDRDATSCDERLYRDGSVVDRFPVEGDPGSSQGCFNSKTNCEVVGTVKRCYPASKPYASPVSHTTILQYSGATCRGITLQYVPPVWMAFPFGADFGAPPVGNPASASAIDQYGVERQLEMTVQSRVAMIPPWAPRTCRDAMVALICTATFWPAPNSASGHSDSRVPLFKVTLPRFPCRSACERVLAACVSVSDALQRTDLWKTTPLLPLCTAKLSVGPTEMGSSGGNLLQWAAVRPVDHATGLLAPDDVGSATSADATTATRWHSWGSLSNVEPDSMMSSSSLDAFSGAMLPNFDVSLRNLEPFALYSNFDQFPNDAGAKKGAQTLLSKTSMGVDLSRWVSPFVETCAGDALDRAAMCEDAVCAPSCPSTFLDVAPAATMATAGAPVNSSDATATVATSGAAGAGSRVVDVLPSERQCVSWMAAAIAGGSVIPNRRKATLKMPWLSCGADLDTEGCMAKCSDIAAKSTTNGTAAAPPTACALPCPVPVLDKADYRFLTITSASVSIAGVAGGGFVLVTWLAFPEKAKDKITLWTAVSTILAGFAMVLVVLSGAESVWCEQSAGLKGLTAPIAAEEAGSGSKSSSLPPPGTVCRASGMLLHFALLQVSHIRV